MLVYDITNEKSFSNIKNWIRNIEEVRTKFNIANILQNTLHAKANINLQRAKNNCFVIFSHYVFCGLWQVLIRKLSVVSKYTIFYGFFYFSFFINRTIFTKQAHFCKYFHSSYKHNLTTVC